MRPIWPNPIYCNDARLFLQFSCLNYYAGQKNRRDKQSKCTFAGWLPNIFRRGVMNSDIQSDLRVDRLLSHTERCQRWQLHLDSHVFAVYSAQSMIFMCVSSSWLTSNANDKIFIRGRQSDILQKHLCNDLIVEQIKEYFAIFSLVALREITVIFRVQIVIMVWKGLHKPCVRLVYETKTLWLLWSSAPPPSPPYNWCCYLVLSCSWHTGKLKRARKATAPNQAWIRKYFQNVIRLLWSSL